MPRGLRLGMRFSPERSAAPAANVTAPSFFGGNGNNVVSTITNATPWTSGADFIPSGQSLVVIQTNGGRTREFPTLTGGSVTSAVRVGSADNNSSVGFALHVYLVEASAASTLTITPETANSIVVQCVAVFSTGGLSSSSPIVSATAGADDTADPVSRTLNSVNGRYIFAACFSRQGTTTALAWGGDFVSGDLITTRNPASNTLAAWTGGNLLSFAFKQAGATDFVSTLDFTDDGTRSSIMAAIAFNAA